MPGSHHAIQRIFSSIARANYILAGIRRPNRRRNEREKRGMPTSVKRDGITIVINPIPAGRLNIKKRRASGALICDRCGRESVNAQRDQGGWELWFLMTRYTDLCPECVPKVTAIVGESRRISKPPDMDEDESNKQDIPF